MSQQWLVLKPGVLFNRGLRQFAIVFRNGHRALAQIRQALPFVIMKPWRDKQLVVLPCTEDTIRLLENLNLKCDGMEPYRLLYNTPAAEGRYPPMAHQITTAAFCSIHKRAFVTSTMRTGKTFSMVACMDYLQSRGKVQGAALIIATVSNLTGVWYDCLCKTLPHRKAVVVHGGTGKKDRLKKLAEPAHYYIINYDGVKMVKDELIRMVRDKLIGMVVVDELTHYGNPQSGRWKALNAVLNGSSPVPYVWGLTGSPGDNPIPIYGFVKLINPTRMPCARLSTWRELTMIHWGRETWQWRPRPESNQIIYETMQPNIRFDKKDIMDLPPVVRQRRDCYLSGEQQNAYGTMKAEMVALLESGEMIEAVHKASLVSKLFQIALGTAIIGGGKKVQLDNTSRVDVIEECIKEASQKVVIFCAYTGVIDRLAEQLMARKYAVAIVDGRVTGKQRATIFRDFQTKKVPQILICHPQTTAFGVELSAADTMIFNGPPLSGGFVYEQALERLSSLKQQASQIAIIQIAATAEERLFFDGLDRGVKSSALVNDMFTNLTKNSVY